MASALVTFMDPSASGALKPDKLSEFLKYLDPKQEIQFFELKLLLSVLTNTSTKRPALFQRIFTENKFAPWKAVGKWLATELAKQVDNAENAKTRQETVMNLLQVLGKVNVNLQVLQAGSTAKHVKQAAKSKNRQSLGEAPVKLASNLVKRWTAVLTAPANNPNSSSSSKPAAKPGRPSEPQPPTATALASNRIRVSDEDVAATLVTSKPRSDKTTNGIKSYSATRFKRDKEKKATATTSVPIIAPARPAPIKKEVVRASQGLANALRAPSTTSSSSSTATSLAKRLPGRRPSSELLKPPMKKPKPEATEAKKAKAIPEPDAVQDRAARRPSATSAPQAQAKSEAKAPPAATGPPPKLKKRVRWRTDLVEVREYELAQEERNEKLKSFHEANRQEHMLERESAATLRQEHAIQPTRSWETPVLLNTANFSPGVDSVEKIKVAASVSQELASLSLPDSSPREPPPEDAVPTLAQERIPIIPLDAPALVPTQPAPAAPAVAPAPVQQQQQQVVPDQVASAVLQALMAQSIQMPQPPPAPPGLAQARPPPPPASGHGYAPSYDQPRDGPGYGDRGPPMDRGRGYGANDRGRGGMPPAKRPDNRGGPMGGRARRPCHFFRSPQGCRNGDNCRFLHE